MGFFAFLILFELGRVWGGFGGSVDRLLITFSGRPFGSIVLEREVTRSSVPERPGGLLSRRGLVSPSEVSCPRVQILSRRTAEGYDRVGLAHRACSRARGPSIVGTRPEMNVAVEAGKAEAVREMARRMLDKGISEQIVCETTGLRPPDF